MDAGNPIFRQPDSVLSDHLYFEKRQVFLRSYKFCRKKGVSEKIKLSIFRVRKFMWVRFRQLRRLRGLIWARLRRINGRKRFHRLENGGQRDDWACCW
ncbi:hypothetical protein AMTRI_Chr08g202400 [Amborella trichopoda]